MYTSSSQDQSFFVEFINFVKQRKIIVFFIVLQSMLFVGGYLAVKLFFVRDIYWKKIVEKPLQYQEFGYNGFRIVNNSFLPVRKLEFSFRVYGHRKGIVALYSQAEADELSFDNSDDQPNIIIYCDDPSVKIDVCKFSRVTEQKSWNDVFVTLNELGNRSSAEILILERRSAHEPLLDNIRLRLGEKSFSDKANRSPLATRDVFEWSFVAILLVQVLFFQYWVFVKNKKLKKFYEMRDSNIRANLEQDNRKRVDGLFQELKV